MGSWGGIKALGSAIVGGVKKAGNAIGNGLKKAGSAIKNGATNLWGKASGKSTFDEADRLYKEVKLNYDKERREFETNLNIQLSSIENHVTSINNSKAHIKSNLFPQLVDLLSKIKDVDINETFPIEEYISKEYSFDAMRSKGQLYKIDFNRHKFKSNALAVITLGFATRKKAKETLLAVEEEQKKNHSEIAKMKIELTRIKHINDSLANVDEYFKTMIRLYEAMIVRCDGAVNYLYLKCLSFAHKLVDNGLSVKMLPVVQQKEIEAIVTMSKILKEMTETHIVSIENKDHVIKFEDIIKKQHDEAQMIYDAA